MGNKEGNVIHKLKKDFNYISKVIKKKKDLKQIKYKCLQTGWWEHFVILGNFYTFDILCLYIIIKKLTYNG